MKLSIVTTLYYSSQYLDEFYQRISKVAAAIDDNYEIIFVNDGSPDDSLETALLLLSKDNRIRIVDLSRNFGHYQAAMTGLEIARGETIFLIDVDLEESPEWLASFWKEMLKQPDVDVVYGVQEERKGRWFERVSGQFFYKTFNKLSDTKIPQNMVTARLMRKVYVNSILEYKEKNLFVPGLMHLAGFKQKGVGVKKAFKKTTTYTLQKKLKLLITSITSFSSKPLEYIAVLGILLMFLGILSGTTGLIQGKLYTDESLVLFIASLMSFFSGVILICLGIVGLYLSKIYQEVKDRPRVMIKQIYN